MIKNYWAVLIVPVLFFLYSLATISNYGINWDEPYHYRRGQAYLHYFLTGQKTYEGMPKYPPLKGTSDSGSFRNADKLFKEVQDNPALSNPNYRRSYYQDDAWNGEFFIDEEVAFGHPALNGILAALSNKIFYQKLGILGDLESYRLFIILTVFAASVFISVFMWKKYGLVESIVSTLALTTYPLLLGEQHFNIKDPVEMAFYTLTILSFYQAITKENGKWLLISILFFALALSVKFNIVFSLIPMSLWLVFHLHKNKPQPNFIRKALPIAFFAPFIVLGLFIAFFPSIWKNPISGIFEVVRFYLTVGYEQSQPPSYYLLGFFNYYPSLWIAITTPPLVLSLFFTFFFFFKKALAKDSFVLLILLWFLTALLRISLFKALSYNGVRLIMEYIPAMAMMAGIGAGYLISNIKNKILKIHVKKKKSLLFDLSFCFLIFAFLFLPIWQLHPNENVYFNFLIGGLKGAKEKNIPAWGNSYGNAYFPALLWINQNAEENAKVSLPVGNIGNIPRFKLRGDIALSPNYWSGLKHDGEYLIELTYDYPQMEWFALKYLNTAMEPVYEVKVDGVAIAKVWKNEEKYKKAEFKKEAVINLPVKVTGNTLSISLPKTLKVMQVFLSQPTENCAPIITGYVRSSVDGKSWVREAEDIARDQLNRSQPLGLTSTFNFYFVAREAKEIVFEVQNSDACLLKAKGVRITYLDSD